MVKKTLGIAAVLAAGVSFGVESQIVGYMASKTCEEGCMSAQVSTFVPVSGNALLGDITVLKGGDTPITPMNFEVQLLNDDGGTAAVSAETMGDFCSDAVDDYEDEDLAFCYIPDTGKWYLTADRGSWSYEMNEYPIPYGTGLLMYSIGTDAKLQFSGQVGTSYIRVTCDEDCMKLTGNVAPKDMVMGDFSLEPAGDTAITPMNFEIQFLNDDGGTAAVNEDTMGEFCPDAIDDYEDEDLAFCYIPDTKKWYLTADRGSWTYEMNDYPVSAGQGFLLYALVADGGKVVLPPAIEEK